MIIIVNFMFGSFKGIVPYRTKQCRTKFVQ